MSIDINLGDKDLKRIIYDGRELCVNTSSTSTSPGGLIPGSDQNDPYALPMKIVVYPDANTTYSIKINELVDEYPDCKGYIDWGDGTITNFDNNVLGDISHSWPSNIHYTIKIYGKLTFFDIRDMPAIEVDTFGSVYIKNPDKVSFYQCHTLERFYMGVYVHFIDETTDVSNMFYECTNLTYVDCGAILAHEGPNGIDMSSMFYKCINLKEVHFTGGGFIHMSSLEKTFYECYELEYVNSSVLKEMFYCRSLAYTFYKCYKLKYIDADFWDFRGVETCECTFLESGLESFRNYMGQDEGKLTTVCCMFANCTNLKKVSLMGHFQDNVEEMSYMFSGCHNLELVNIGIFHNKTKDMSGMFSFCKSLKNIEQIHNWNCDDLEKTTEMFSMSKLYMDLSLAYWGATKLKEVDHMFGSAEINGLLVLDNLIRPSVTNMKSFLGGAKVKNYAFDSSGTWDMSGVINAENAFSNFITDMFPYTELNNLDNLKYASGMFYYVKNDPSVQPNINLSGLQTAINIEDASNMFMGAFAGCTVDFYDLFKLENATNIRYLFHDGADSTPITLNGLAGLKLENATSAAFAFSNRYLANNELDLSSVSFNNLTDASGIFSQISVENIIGINDFNMINVTNLHYAFFNVSADLLNNIDIFNWDIRNVVTAEGMFYRNAYDPTDIDISIGSLNWENVTNFTKFFQNRHLVTNRYDSFLQALDAQNNNTGITLDMGTSKYTPGGAAEDARNNLINNKGWTINDGGPV